MQAGLQMAPPHPPATKRPGHTAPTALRHPWLGLPAVLALSSIQRQPTIDNTQLKVFQMGNVVDEQLPKRNKLIYYKTLKEL